MGNLNLKYSGLNTISVTLASLSPAAARESLAVNNTAVSPFPFIDAIVRLKVKLQAGTPTPGAAIAVYLSMSDDGGTWLDNSTGTDAGITLRAPTNLVVPAPISQVFTQVSGALTWNGFIPSVATGFGGFLPPYWSIIVVNNTGIAFDATEANHDKRYTGVYVQTN